MATAGTLRAGFLASLGFEPDPFQVEAMDALDEGHSVVVAAPTGSGKTLVAGYAVAKALASSGKAFYTTPLKALSNQKFADLSRQYGSSRVGLLTGDNSVNGEAPVVVMTTEVLRSMIYAGSTALAGLRYVVLDEVHYLQDPYRGPVWEEVIIHLPPEVDLVCLSATVSNAEELADWVAAVRGSTRAVIEERRPVPLHNLFLVGDRRTDQLVLLPTLVDGRPNPSGLELAQRGAGPRWQAYRRHGGGPFVPRRAEVVEVLREEGLLPAIYFIFSRAGCEEAVRQCTRDHGRLTSPSERRQIRKLAEEATARVPGADLAALDWGQWAAALEAGFAAHHAGMVPPFKEAVERCFLAGLVKVVFATETLALGINMPARSVVIERLSKFSGESVQPLTPGEYTQLTGRAGRRGTDDVGYAVVLWAPEVSFEQVASLAGARSYTLTSSFRPTYNMATNLVRRCSPAQARHLLNLSFAQYRSDADVVRLERQLERSRLALAEAEEGAACELGDVFAFRRLASPGRSPGGGARPTAADVLAALERLQPGDVIELPARRAAGAPAPGRAAVLSTSQRKKGDLVLRAVTAGRQLVTLAPRDFHAPPTVLGRLQLPVPFAPTRRGCQRQLAAALEGVPWPGRPEPGDGPVAAHPVAACPDLRAHLRDASRAERLQRQVSQLEKQVKSRNESLARQLDRVLGLLESWGYVRGWSLTQSGGRLARIYHPGDLLVAEAVERGLLDGLRLAELAAVASFFTYEARGPSSATGPPQRLPTRRVEQRWHAVEPLAAELNRAEEAAGLPLTRLPDAGFAALAYEWAAGKALAHVLALPAASPGAGAVPAGAQPGRSKGARAARGLPGPAMSPGDFVRNVKQLTDLLRQLGDILPDAESCEAARAVSKALFRGVVAVSSVVEAGDGEGDGDSTVWYPQLAPPRSPR